ncbi:hypothetical protein [Sphingomonas sp.]|jgi:hypothetical protein|uniref:hypothetical protein n=1 Tax=Sphingomonas sp. TaxID=28214 RepID=UPI002D7E5570|nr:hypothetical protein [Sphingomonas sp.]HEU0045230.1 hypothetical protein [Sphingomonas sp.]
MPDPKITKKKFPIILQHAGFDWDRKQQADDAASGARGFIPPAYEHWTLDGGAVALFFLEQRKAGQTVKVAGAAATRLGRGMLDHPTADQLTALTLENGSTSIHPTASLALASGYVGGGYVATATMIDVRNLRARIQRAIDADAAIIGDDDAE